jgi:hypothetical protein
VGVSTTFQFGFSFAERLTRRLSLGVGMTWEG